MRIAILTVGSYGDLRPYLALANALNARGHEVRVHAPDHFVSYAQAARVPFAGLGPHFSDAVLKRVLAAMAEERDAKRHPEIILRMSHTATLALAERAVQTTQGADLILAHNLSVLGLVAAEANRIPYVTGHLFPSLIPSSTLWLTGRDLGRPLNRLMWTLTGVLVGRRTDPYYADVLKRFDLAPRKDMLLRNGHSPLLNLVAVSPRVLPPDPAWSEHYTCTGYLNLPDPEFVPDAALRAFVEDGEPPVVVSFGSMYGLDAAELTRLLIMAFADSKRRVLLQAGWAGIGQGALPEHMRVADFVSHEWLLPRAACVVHHGGAGTTAAALHAGTPQVIVHHLGDQPFWGRHMRRLGVSRHSVAHRSLSAEWLCKAVTASVDDVRLKTRAEHLAALLRAEDGVARAVTAIERVAHEQRPYRRSQHAA